MTRTNGYQTIHRQKILSYLQEHESETVTVSDIINAVCKENEINKTTVYRYLDKLVADGNVLKYVAFKGAMATYQYVERPKACKEHLHMKCEQCGKVYHLDCEFMYEIREHMQKHHRFELSCENSILSGLCETCAEKKKQNESF